MRVTKSRQKIDFVSGICGLVGRELMFTVSVLSVTSALVILRACYVI